MNNKAGMWGRLTFSTHKMLKKKVRMNKYRPEKKHYKREGKAPNQWRYAFEINLF